MHCTAHVCAWSLRVETPEVMPSLRVSMMCSCGGLQHWGHQEGLRQLHLRQSRGGGPGYQGNPNG